MAQKNLWVAKSFLFFILTFSMKIYAHKGIFSESFVESMFEEDRKSKLKNALVKPHKSLKSWLVTKESQRDLVDYFDALWVGSDDLALAYDSSSDKDLIRFLKEYFTKNNFFMYKPNITTHYSVNKKRELLSNYSVESYEKISLSNQEGRKEFFKLFLTGAHFVVSHSRKESKIEIPDFRYEFKSKLKTSYAFSHSHYTKVIAWFGLVYPSKVLSPRPVVNSLLLDHTSHFSPNSFFQLEGWPAYKIPYRGSKRDIRRHRADYRAHLESKWNISTYGASVYSEKNGTSVYFRTQDFDSN